MTEMTTPIRVLVVDDDPLARASLRVMLGGSEAIDLASMLTDGDELTPEALSGIDVVLMDIVMAREDGLTATRRITAHDPHPAIIVLTTFDTEDHVLEAVRHGAAGYLLKDAPPPQIVDAIVRVAAGESVLSGAVTHRLLARVRAESRARGEARERLSTLTSREREIARAIGRGLSNNQIAEELFLGLATVKSHLGQVFSKLQVTGRVQVAILVHEADEDR